LLDIVRIGFPVLREIARPVESVESPDVQTLIDSLIETLIVSNGVGIAAPQVGVSLRLFVIAPGPDPRRSDVPEAGPIAIINPEVTSHSPEIVRDWEGCLSIPGIRGLVPRFRSVTLRYQRRDGVSEEAEFTDFIARICQHEYDHLEGLVYLDRMDGVKDIISDDYYRMLMLNT
jgi:peptide deformylase